MDRLHPPWRGKRGLGCLLFGRRLAFGLGIDCPVVDTNARVALMGRRELVRLLDEAQGRVAMAAERLGVDRKTLYRWIEGHGIDLEAHRPAVPSED